MGEEEATTVLPVPAVDPALAPPAAIPPVAFLPMPGTSYFGDSGGGHGRHNTEEHRPEPKPEPIPEPKPEPKPIIRPILTAVGSYFTQFPVFATANGQDWVEATTTAPLGNFNSFTLVAPKQARGE